MLDVVRYVLPADRLGRWLHTVKIRRDLERIFDYRSARIRSLFPGPDPGPQPVQRW
jgi:hypothetical protein